MSRWLARLPKKSDRFNRVLIELKEYLDEMLYSLAARNIEIDLDDGIRLIRRSLGKLWKKYWGKQLITGRKFPCWILR